VEVGNQLRITSYPQNVLTSFNTLNINGR